MSTLIYLVHTLPESGGFCTTELRYLARHFDKIIVISNVSRYEPLKILPAGCSLIEFPYLPGTIEKIQSLLQVFNPVFRTELRWLTEKKGIRLSKQVVFTLLQTLYTAQKLKKIILRLCPEIKKGEKVGVYSFWMNNMAVGVAQLKQAYPHIYAACRGHGSDIYFESQALGFQPFRPFIAARMDRIRFVSQMGLRYFEKLLGSKHPEWGVSYLGSLPPERPVIAEQPEEGSPLLLTCSLVTPVKRLPLLIDALKEINRPLRWLHIGDGPGLSSIKEQAATLPPAIQAEFSGYVGNDRLVAYIQQKQPVVMVNVSSSEGLPVSMMEAMSLGVPVIGTNVGGVHEIIDHGVNGMLMPANPGPREVARFIQDFLALPGEERSRFRKAARQKWESLFNGDTNYNVFAQELAEAVGRKAS